MTPKSLIGSALDLSWSDNLNQTNTWTKQERQQTSHKDDEQHNVALRRQNHERENEIDVKITYFNKREREKRVRGVILNQIDFKSPLFDEWMKRNWGFGDGSQKRRRRERLEKEKKSVVWYTWVGLYQDTK